MKYLVRSIVLASSAFLACVGSDPLLEPGPVVTEDGGTVPEAGSDSSTVPPSEAGTDAGVVCASNEAACGATCADLQTSAAHCGKCAHSCLGGACVEGECKPSTFRGTLAKNARLALSATDVLFTDGMKISRCPASGCAAAPATMIQFTQYDFPALPATLVASKSTLLFQGSRDKIGTQFTGLFYCPATGCVVSPPPNQGDGAFITVGAFAASTTSEGKVAYVFNNNASSTIKLTDCDNGACSAPTELLPDNSFTLWGAGLLASDDTNVYFIHNNVGSPELRYCARAGCAGTPPLVGALSTVGGNAPVGIAVRGGRVYIAQSNGNVSSVLACQVATGCSPVASALLPIVRFATDATRFYAASDLSNTVYSCLLTGCGAGPTIHLQQQAVTLEYTDLAARDGSVYWIEAYAADASIRRLVLP